MENKKNWYIYVVSCFDNSLYCGITTDLIRRLKQHNGIISGGSKYTRSRRPVKLVWFDTCLNRSEASKREHSFKKLKKAEKLSFISNKDYLK